MKPKKKTILLYQYKYIRESKVSIHQGMADKNDRFKGFATVRSTLKIENTESCDAVLDYEDKYVLSTKTTEKVLKGVRSHALMKKLKPKVAEIEQLFGYHPIGMPITNNSTPADSRVTHDRLKILNDAVKKHDIKLMYG